MLIASLFLALFLSFCHSHHTTPDYCQCNEGLFYDPNRECLSSGDHNVQNACFVCPVTNTTNGVTLTYYYCGSMYNLSFGTCAQQGSYEARVAACLAIGGNPDAADFTCEISSGTDQSQVTCQVTPESTPTDITNSPTSGSNSSSHSFSASYVVAIFSIVYLFFKL